MKKHEQQRKPFVFIDFLFNSYKKQWFSLFFMFFLCVFIVFHCFPCFHVFPVPGPASLSSKDSADRGTGKTKLA